MLLSETKKASELGSLRHIDYNFYSIRIKSQKNSINE